MSKKINVQILRVFACLGVFLVHFGQRMSLTGTVRTITEFGKYGVELFIILSGYLAFLSLNKKNSGGGIIDYYKKRSIRLLPLYFIIILYYLLTELFIWKSIPTDELKLNWFRYIFLLNGFVGSETYFWGNLGITWTIPLFAFFYLIAPFLNKIIKNVWQTLILFAIAYLLGAISIRYLQIGANRTLSWFNNFIYLKYFCLGIIIYFIEKGNYNIQGIALFAIVCIPFAVFELVEMQYAIIFCIIFIASNMLDFSKMPKKVSKIINLLDEYSYTLYLGHGIVFCGIIDKVNMPKYLVACVAVFGTIIITFVLRKLIEKPAQKLLTKILFYKHSKPI